MAVYLIGCDAVIIHLPKTAIHWVEQACRSNGVPVRLVTASGKVHRKLSIHTYLNDKKIANPRYRTCFVRRPESWYKSWYSFTRTPAASRDMPISKGPSSDTKQKEKLPWSPVQCLPHVGDFSGFNEWVEACVEKQPGFVTRMYEWYIGPPGLSHMDYVGRFEHLHEHLHAMLKIFGVNVSVEKLKEVEPVNVSRPSEKPEWEPDLLKKVLELEAPTIDRFYGDNQYNINPV